MLQKSDEDKLAAEIDRVMKEGRKDLEEEQERIYNLIAQEKEQSLLKVIHKNTAITSPRKLTQIFTDNLLSKLTGIKNSIPSLTIIARLC